MEPRGCLGHRGSTGSADGPDCLLRARAGDRQDPDRHQPGAANSLSAMNSYMPPGFQERGQVRDECDGVPLGSGYIAVRDGEGVELNADGRGGFKFSSEPELSGFRRFEQRDDHVDASTPPRFRVVGQPSPGARAECDGEAAAPRAWDPEEVSSHYPLSLSSPSGGFGWSPPLQQAGKPVMPIQIQ